MDEMEEHWKEIEKKKWGKGPVMAALLTNLLHLK